ncbi:MAG TPA: MFS transporter, partial [Ferrovibrio sp.]|uniref:MFS transporter n=1 Tax=Ferrovibrio sp. TaxID=1917215 RepID=UPI002B4AF0AD
MAIAPVGALLLSVALLLTGNGLQGTLLPVRASMENFSALSIGVLGASYYSGFVVGCMVTPRLIQRVGHIRLFTAMVAAASATPLLHALVVTPVFWWVLRALTGLFLASLYLIIESWLNERATSANRGMVFTTYTTVNFTVLTLGQLLMLTDDPKNFPLYTIASILVSLAAIPVALTRSPQPA